MKLSRLLPSTIVKFSLFLATLVIFTSHIYSQETVITLQRGYRTGYSDGYMAGYRDSVENMSNSVVRHADYNRADRAYTKETGALEDYRDGYQQGFESGYATGFSKGNFNAALPANLRRRDTVAPAASAEPISPAEPIAVSAPAAPPVVTETVSVPETPVAPPPPAEPLVETKSEPAPLQTAPVAPPANYATGDVIIIPVETDLIIELIGDINTNSGKVGDRFQARVVSPGEITGAIVEGRIDKIQRPGRINRRSELQLVFDQIRLSDNRWSNMRATLTEVLPLKGDNVRRVDVEGTVEGRSSVRSDIVKVGATTGTGTIIGAIAGGPVGAAVGAAVGAGVGMGVILTERGKHIYLVKGQQLRVKTVYETQIR